MAKYQKLEDINKNFCLANKDHGIQLIYPENVNKNNKLYTISDIFKLTCNIYFIDTHSVVHGSNEECARSCLFDSANSVRGKNVYQFSEKSSAHTAAINNLNVINTKTPKIIEEEAIFPDSSFYQCLTIKLPWYNNDKKLIGVFGCSIVYGIHNLPETLEHFVRLGILNIPAMKSQLNFNTGKYIDGIFLTKRELECMYYVIRGKTTKHIANILGLSKRTVESYIENVKKKFELYSKAELIDKVFDYLV